MSAVEIAVRGTALVYALPDGASVTVGRVGLCEIHVDDQAVSRRHCSLVVRGADVLITDLDSANGTFLNERQVKSGTAHPGDLIRVGSTVLEYRDPETRPSSGTARVAAEADRGIESVIRRRIDPADVEWLSSGTSALPALELLQRAQRHLKTLHRVSEALAGSRDLQALASIALETILDVTAADRAAFVLKREDGSGGEADVAAVRLRHGPQGAFTLSRTIVADTITKGVSSFARDASADTRFSGGQSVIGQGIRSVMCVPLRTTDQILGALYVDSQSGPGRFSEEDLELLAAIGNHAGVALHRVRLIGELERLLLDTIRAIAATIDAKDGYTHRHSERVAALAARIAAEMGLGAEHQELAELSALLHDVGKIAVPDSILNKPGRLTPEEFAEMRKHPEHGARILENIQSPLVKAVLPGVRYHHERWDGTGYPEGLHGDSIPLLGRLLGVADFLDALTSARAYHEPKSIEEVVQLIVNGSGVHFDPQIAAAVVRLHGRGALNPGS
ncbi:MAG TPA: HD domain-containing phosphohydrolase [Vicinamibacterales bacterium]|jgi:putative nucleotidyltransferase with HDIG domain